MKAFRIALGAAMGACLGIAGSCSAPDVSQQPAEQPSSGASQDSAGTTAAAVPATNSAALDFSALQEQEDPEKLLRFYTEAVRLGDWNAAAKAWSSDALVSAATLRQAFGDRAPPNLVVGKGDTLGAAGTLFYEAPIVATFPDKSQPERRGTIVLQRANDVPGASEEQLNWRIERSTVLEPTAE